MKKIIVTLVLVISSTIIFAQTMVVKQSNGTYQEIAITTAVELSFYSPCVGTPTVSYSGQTYNTVQIGSQCWLKENLNVGTYMPSTSAADSQTYNGGDGVIQKYCYGNTEANCTANGGLYQWNEAMQYHGESGSQGICPSGWHIPTASQLHALGGPGNYLKAIGQGTGSGAGTNTSGFSALLAGYRTENGSFTQTSLYTFYWSSDVADATYANGTYLPPSSDNFFWGGILKTWGVSVRCLKN